MLPFTLQDQKTTAYEPGSLHYRKHDVVRKERWARDTCALMRSLSRCALMRSASRTALYFRACSVWISHDASEIGRFRGGGRNGEK